MFGVLVIYGVAVICGIAVLAVVYGVGVPFVVLPLRSLVLIMCWYECFCRGCICTVVCCYCDVAVFDVGDDVVVGGCVAVAVGVVVVVAGVGGSRG